jgi:hypothetical protein
MRTMAPSSGEPAAATPNMVGTATGAAVLVVVTGVLAVVVPEPVVLGVEVVVDVLVVDVVPLVLGLGVTVEVLVPFVGVLDVDDVLLPPPPQALRSADTISVPTQVT